MPETTLGESRAPRRRRQKRKRIAVEISRFENRERIRVSAPAKEIITTTLLAITDDPNPDWSGPSPESVQSELISQLPMLLREVPIQSDGRRVNTFTLLHVISAILDRACPFEKPRSRVVG